MPNIASGLGFQTPTHGTNALLRLRATCFPIWTTHLDCITIHQSGSGSEERMAQLKVKAESGLVKTINVTTTILKQGDLLTSDSKRRVVNYINVAFGKELSELEASKKAGFSTMAVLLMKREYEKPK